MIDISTQFDNILKTELTKRLKRDPLQTELVNADNDSDLVNETLWQLVENLANRVQALEDNATVINTVPVDKPAV